jgi:nucleoside-diphosphate-sugar epimerase
MRRCLLGWSGFVGSNLARQAEFDECYRSTDIDTIRGRSFSEIYCAAAPAAKWIANREPDQDLLNITRLMNALRHVKADRFILISTVDVYKTPQGVDENSPIDQVDQHAYGFHRRLLELFVRERFQAHAIIRLPGLFGPGLKKNIIFDFLHHNNLDLIHADARFQFYSLETLFQDILIMLGQGLSLMNFATEPVTVAEVARVGFGIDFDNRPSGGAASYDMQTTHAAIFGRPGRYLQSRDEVLAKIHRYIQQERG